MRRFVTAFAACAALVSAQDADPTFDVDSISVAVPTSVFNIPVVYVTAEDAPTITAVTVAAAATPSSDPLATDVFDSPADVTSALSVASVEASATSNIAKRGAATCVPQPTGISENPAPKNDPASFVADPYWANTANAAVSPSDYYRTFQALTASNSADNYKGYTLLSSYDTGACATKCNSITGCNSFGIYFERDPSLNPDDVGCPNPDAAVNIKCVFWGGAVTEDNANNFGQWRSKFQVLIAGSNGYIKKTYYKQLVNGQIPSSAKTYDSIVNSGQNNYEIYMSSDTNQGAYANGQASSSYLDCNTLCDKTDSCAGYTYVGKNGGSGAGTCWLKAAFGAPTSSGSNVISGRKRTKLQIVKAYYGNTDVTTQATYVFAKGKNLVIDTSNLQDSLAVDDPTPGYTDSLFILYNNGSNTRIFNARETTGVYTLQPSGSNSAPNCADLYAPVNSGASQVLSANYGGVQVADSGVYNTLNSRLADHGQFQIENYYMGGDPWVGTLKTGVIVYNNAANVISTLAFHEHDTVSFPN